MIPDGDGKSESSKVDPDQIARMLELEMAQKRAEWIAASARHHTIRTISIVFLAIVVMGALLAFFLMFTQLSQQHPGGGTRAQPTATP